jgi:Lar family restriction alleviation protein
MEAYMKCTKFKAIQGINNEVKVIYCDGELPLSSDDVLGEVGELLPCPFCGCVIIKTYRNGNSHYLYCDDCGARTNNFSIHTEKEKVIRYWNKRANFA